MKKRDKTPPAAKNSPAKLLAAPARKLEVHFYQLRSGKEPVREWLKAECTKEERKAIGTDIKAMQERWPVGMPLVRPLGNHLWEVRTHLQDKIARVFYTIKGHTAYLLHGIIKKTEQTPQSELDLAIKRMKEVQQ